MFTERSGQTTGNAQFAVDLSSWTFQETLVYKIQSSGHFLASDPSRTQRDHYTTNDELVRGCL